jgi:hypothetical protein
MVSVARTALRLKVSKLTATYQDELGNDFTTRIQGTRLRHHMVAGQYQTV